MYIILLIITPFFVVLRRRFRKGWTAKLFSRSWCTNKIKDNQGDPFKLNPLQASLSLGGSLFNYTIRGHSITTWTRRGWEEVSRMSTLGHVTKGRYHVKYPKLSTQGGEGVKIGQNLVHVVIEWTLTVDKRQSQSNLHLNTAENFVFFLPRINQLHIINAVNMGNCEEFLCDTISFYERNSWFENFHGRKKNVLVNSWCVYSRMYHQNSR